MLSGVHEAQSVRRIVSVKEMLISCQRAGTSILRENTELTQSVNSHQCIDHPEGKCANEEACDPLP